MTLVQFLGPEGGTCLTALDVAVSGGQVQGGGRVLVLHVDVCASLNQSLAHAVMTTHLPIVSQCSIFVSRMEEVNTHISHQGVAYCSEVERC